MLKSKYLIQELVNHILIPQNFKRGSCPKNPTIACLFLTKKCNSRCTICEYWKSDRYDELSTMQWHNVIDQLRKMGIKMINFTADGEIFTRKDAFEILKYAKKEGFLISINTNGLALSRHIERIVELNPLQLQISLDAFDDELYQVIRGVPSGFSRVKNSILELKRRGFNKISIGSVLTADNLDALPLLQNFCIEHGFSYRVTAFQFQGFNVDNRRLRSIYREKKFIDKLDSTIKILSQQPMNNTLMYLESIKNYYLQDKYHPLDCIVGHYKIFILPNGDVSLCNMMRDNALIGNILQDEALTDIWSSERTQYVRKNIKSKKCPSCWLSCFAEDNIRFSTRHAVKQIPYFLKKATRLFR